MQKIIPHLWYDKEAKEAAQFYTTIFPRSEIMNTTTLHDTPSGDSDIVSFKLMDYSFKAISAGPYFQFNPSISFMINFDPSKDGNARSQLDDLWKQLVVGGKILMELDKYPFSEWYGWVQDKYGLSWQLMLTNPEGDERSSIIPSLLFVGDVAGKAKEASDLYLSVFKNSHRGVLTLYPPGMEPEKEGTTMFSDFTLENQWFVAMDSANSQHNFAFNEAISFIVETNSQEELDYYWEKLSAVPESEQCGWLKDAYGVSWQIVPTEMDEMMKNGTHEQIDRVTQAFLPMKKLDIAALKEAYEDKT